MDQIRVNTSKKTLANSINYTSLFSDIGGMTPHFNEKELYILFVVIIYAGKGLYITMNMYLQIFRITKVFFE